jgi:hypothetical protein
MAGGVVIAALRSASRRVAYRNVKPRIRLSLPAKEPLDV